MKIRVDKVGALQLYQLARFGTLLALNVVLAQMGLETRVIGQYESFLLASSALSFWVSGLMQSYLPRASQPGAELGAALLLLAHSLVAAGVLYLFAGSLVPLLTGEDDYPHADALLAQVLLSGLSFLAEHVLVGRDKPVPLLAYGALALLGQTAAVLLPLALGWGMGGALWGLVAVSAARVLWLFPLLGRRGWQWQPGALSEHWRAAWPLLGTTLLGSSAQYVDGLLVAARFDGAGLALFRYGAKELPLSYLMANALSNSMLADFGRREDWPAAMRRLRDKTRRLAHLVFPTSALLILGSHWFYPLVFNPDFAASVPVFNLYMLLAISRLLFPQPLILGAGRTRFALWVSVGELALNVGLSLALLPFWGMAGVAAATVVAHLAQKIAFALHNRVHWGIRLAEYCPLELYLPYSALLLACYAWASY